MDTDEFMVNPRRSENLSFHSEEYDLDQFTHTYYMRHVQLKEKSTHRHSSVLYVMAM